MWPDDRILKLLDIEHPIIQAPMAGASNPDLVAAVSEAGADLVEKLVIESRQLMTRLVPSAF